MKPLLLALAVGLMFTVPPTLTLADSEEETLPPAQVQHVSLSNKTDGPITFYLETARIAKTEYQLPPNGAATFTGAPGDDWFNVHVYSNNESRAYGLEAGTQHYFVWTAAGTLEVRDDVPVE